MKNGLVRVQCYLPIEVYQELMSEFDRLNEEREDSKLSESAFYYLKLTGTEPRRRGAPQGNKNAASGRLRVSSEKTENIQIEDDDREVLQKHSGEKFLSKNETLTINLGESDLPLNSEKLSSTLIGSPRSSNEFETEKNLSETYLHVSNETVQISHKKMVIANDDFLEEAFAKLDELGDTKQLFSRNKDEG